MTRAQLIAQIKEKKSFLCIGLDTDINLIPKNKLEKDLKTQIDENKSEYEKILDEATEKIEDFLKKTNINKPLQ